jgi:5-formyltetrahydrofolate cyclo-ligase
MGEDAGTDGTSGALRAKRALRRELLARRRSVAPGRRADVSRAIVAQLRRLPELAAVPDGARPRNLLAYVAEHDEVDLTALLTDPPGGARTLLPRVDDGLLVAVPHEHGAPLVPGAFGILEPVGPAVDPALVDVVIVPAVAFTPDGSRLGRGAGLYDRLLVSLRPDVVLVGVCGEEFVVPELPLEAHDQPVGILVTDASTRRRDTTRSTDGAPPHA